MFNRSVYGEAFSSEMTERVCSQALQIFGGMAT